LAEMVLWFRGLEFLSGVVILYILSIVFFYDYYVRREFYCTSYWQDIYVREELCQLEILVLDVCERKGVIGLFR